MLINLLHILLVIWIIGGCLWFGVTTLGAMVSVKCNTFRGFLQVGFTVVISSLIWPSVLLYWIFTDSWNDL